MPVALQVILGIAAALTATSTVWRLFIKPMAELIVLQQQSMPMLRELVRVFAAVPAPFDVLGEIVAEFRTDSGSSLRDVVNRLDHAANENKSSAEVLKVQVESSRMLAVQDREQLQRLIVFLDRLTVKIDAGDIVRNKMVEADAAVADALADSHHRADTAGEAAGEAADAASRSPVDKDE